MNASTASASVRPGPESRTSRRAPPSGRDARDQITRLPAGPTRTRVVGERVQHLAHPSGVGANDDVLAWDVDVERQFGAHEAVGPGSCPVLHQATEVDLVHRHREVVGLESRQGQQVVDVALQALRLLRQRGGHLRQLLGSVDAVDQRLGVAADRGQRGAELVGDGQQEPALPLLAGGQCAVELPQGLGDLDHLARGGAGDVAGHAAFSSRQPAGGGCQSSEWTAQLLGHHGSRHECDEEPQGQCEKQPPSLLGHRVVHVSDAPGQHDRAAVGQPSRLHDHGFAGQLARRRDLGPAEHLLALGLGQRQCRAAGRAIGGDDAHGDAPTGHSRAHDGTGLAFTQPLRDRQPSQQVGIADQ